MGKTLSVHVYVACPGLNHEQVLNPPRDVIHLFDQVLKYSRRPDDQLLYSVLSMNKVSATSVALVVTSSSRQLTSLMKQQPCLSCLTKLSQQDNNLCHDYW